MDLQRDGLLCVAAALAGAVNAVAGGGTLLSFPAAMAWGLPSTIANATNCVAMTPASLASAWAYRRELRTGRSILALLALPAIAGGVAGAILLRYTPARVFDAIVPWLVLGATLLIALQGHLARATPAAPSRGRALAAVGCQLLVGVYGGFFGAAMGIITLAFLSLLMPGDIHARNAVKNLIAALVNGVAAGYFLAAGLVDRTAVVLMVAGAMIGGLIGGQLARRVPARAVQWLVVGIGVVLALMLALRRWR